jgi:hypothetical protein
MNQTDLQGLLTYLDRADDLWELHRSQWIGRQVRLCKPLAAGLLIHPRGLEGVSDSVAKGA